MDDLLRLEIYWEEGKDIETVEIPRGEFVSSALSFLRSSLEAFPDEELMRELEIAEELARREGLLPAEEKFEIKVEWLGEVNCRRERLPLVYTVVSCGREIFSGLVEPLAFAGALINLLKLAKGIEVGCEVDMTPYNDIVERAMSLVGDEKVSDYLVLWFGAEWPGTVFVFKKGSELVFVNVKTGSVIGVKKEEVESVAANTVGMIIEKLRDGNGELSSLMGKEDLITMLAKELDATLPESEKPF
ncbi:hypothetical protein TAM4_926 [Thermococcus sp. AM4]|nr:hypothetical protein TAM4_926 [Thermococcus sp. AM4]